VLVAVSDGVGVNVAPGVADGVGVGVGVVQSRVITTPLNISVLVYPEPIKDVLT